MPYILTIIPLYLALSAQLLLKYKGPALFLIALMPLGLLAILRGNIGVDTPTYESVIRYSLDGGSNRAFEPGFFWLVNLMSLITDNEVVVLRLFSLMIVILLVVYLVKSDKDEAFLLAAFFLPMSFFDLTTNAIRFGVSISLFLIALQFSWRGKNICFILLSILSVLFHYSIILCLAIYLVATKGINFKMLLFGLICSITVLFIAFIDLSDYTAWKYLAYSDFSALSNLSGLRYVSVLLLLMVGTLVSSLSFNLKKKQIIFGSVLLLFGLILTQLSYAGLRVLYLFVFIYPLLDLTFHKAHLVKINSNIKAIWFIAGVISFIFLMRGYFNDAGTFFAAHLPYEFFFD
jgi:hypothetical protein